jgi:hypothetical protein
MNEELDLGTDTRISVMGVALAQNYQTLSPCWESYG